jgi:hypothetical protein
MPMFQFQIAAESIQLVPPPNVTLTREMLVYAAVGLGALVVILIVKRFFRRRYQLTSGFRKVVLKVMVPKEAGEKGDAAQQEKSLQQIQEAIAPVVGVFKSLGGLRAQRGFKSWLLGRDDSFSFEIVAKDGLVHFYLAVPVHQRAFIEQQVQAQYPLSQIEEVPDYNIFMPQGSQSGARLGAQRDLFLPFVGFRKLETDPLDALTNALAKVEKTDGAAIQILVRSARREWRSRGVRIASLMQQGRSYWQARKRSSILGSIFGEAGKTEAKTGAAPKEYRLSPLEEEMVKAMEEKVGQLGLDVNVNIVASSQFPEKARMYVNDMIGAFSQYNSPQYGNSFIRKGGPSARLYQDFIFRAMNEKALSVMTGEELAGLWHLPLPSSETPNIRWLTARKAAPPSNLPAEGLLLGRVIYRNHEYPVRIKQPDRMRHMYIIGKSGVGKSEFLKQMMKQDIEAGRGFCAIDPHGELAKDAIRLVPRERAEDVIYFSPADVERPMGLNLMEYDERYPEQKTFVINEMLKIFDKLYDLKSTGGPMFEQYMRNAMILVMDHPESGSTLMEIPRVLSDEKFRAFKLSKCKTQVVKDFWMKEAQKAGGEASLANMVPYITSKLTPFITNDIMRPIIGQQKSAFNVRQAMDEGKILLLDLSKGKLGDLNAYLIGMVLVGKILMAALSRQELEREKRRDFFLYIDEFQNFLTDSIAVILSEARKYGLGLVIAHQYVGQLTKNNDTSIRDAIFGNVGTMMAFRVGAEDAEFLNKEFQPTFTPFDLINAEAASVNMKLLIDNTVSRPFNMTLPPMVKGSEKLVGAIQQLSRLKFGRDRDIVEAEILERTRAG